MIKLRDIWVGIIKESVHSGNIDMTFDFESQYIPTLALPDDIVELIVNIEYDYKSGIPTSYHDHAGQEEQFNITSWEITELYILKNGKEPKKEIKFNLLHPKIQKILETLVEKSISSDEDNIKEKAINNLGI